MKKLFIVSAALFLFACKNEKKADTPANPEQNTTTVTDNNTVTKTDSYSNTTISVEGKELKLNGSILVDKDKKKLLAGAPYRAMITTSSGPDNEGMILRFVFDTKAGTYPLTGMSYGRGTGDAGQQFGGLLGGEEKIYDAKVTLTECKDLGDNGAGGHKWSISGTVDNLTIPAMGLMLMDKEKNHPKEVKIDKISFSGITFDDNAEEMLEKAMDQLKNMKKN
jgi:hypothetical protein